MQDDDRTLAGTIARDGSDEIVSLVVAVTMDRAAEWSDGWMNLDANITRIRNYSQAGYRIEPYDRRLHFIDEREHGNDVFILILANEFR